MWWDNVISDIQHEYLHLFVLPTYIWYLPIPLELY